MDLDSSSYIKGTTFFILISIILYSGCADIGAPPGGEEDKTAPFILQTIPVNGATNVEVDNKIVFHFSERLKKPPQTQKAVFISPRPAQEPEIKWKSDKIIIILADSFKTDQTYIISLSNAVKDLRNNSIGKSSIMAFSTGDFIDSGFISGAIFKEKKAAKNMAVGLYDPTQLADGHLSDSTYPEYVVQTNSTGRFTFNYLPQKEYIMIAFDDRNNNELIDSDKELIAIPDRKIDLADDDPLYDLLMAASKIDSLALKIVSASYTSDKLVKVMLSKEVSTEELNKAEQTLVLRSIFDSSKTYSSSQYLESYLESSDIFHFYFPNIDTGQYILKFNLNKTEIFTFENYKITIKKDENKPQIKKQIPEFRFVFIDEFSLETYFSEAVDTSILTEETFSLWESDNLKIPLKHNWLSPFHIKFEHEPLIKGKQYRFDITEFEIGDLSGNFMGDSLKEFKFSIIDNDSVGQISGNINIEIKEKEDFPVNLIFTRIPNRQKFNLYLTNSKFNIDLPSGKYLLSGYIDSNENKQQDFGSLFPYQYAETFLNYTDTISVRARFETSDIEVNFK